MTEKTQQTGTNLPLVGVGLIVAAAAGIAVGWFARGGVGPKKPEGPAAAVAAKEESPAASAAAGGAGAPTGAAAVEPATTEGPCAEYASTVCGEAGERSDTCSAVRRVAELMPGAACRAALGDTTRMRTGIAEAAKACNDLMSRLCAELGEETPTCAMVREQTPRFSPEQCRQMLDNYPAVYKELQCREMQAKPLAPEALAKLGAGTALSFGPADAKVTVVEFSDFECPHCATAADVARKVKARYGTVVRFVFRHLPLPFHQNAGPAAQASLAAHAQGKFWQYHDLLFANQKSLDRAGLERFAEQAGLDMARFRAALDGGTHAAAVDADKMLAEELCVNGTPSMFVNGDRVRNPTDYAQVAGSIDAALTAAGVPIPPEPTG